MQGNGSSPESATLASKNSLRVVYVFASHRRRADICEHLENLTEQFHDTLDMHKFDLLRGEEQDVLDMDFWTWLIDLVRKIPAFCIITTPPCSIYSRVRHFYNKSPGLRSIRSRQFPLGFSWLTASNRQKAEEGTALACKMWQLFDIAREIESHFLEKFPEDLETTSTGILASIWQMDAFFSLLANLDVITMALFQCEIGAKTPKSMSDLHSDLHSRLEILEATIQVLPPFRPIRTVDRSGRFWKIEDRSSCSLPGRTMPLHW